MSAQLICLLGAECTGKTTLAAQLAEHLECPWVPEYLRGFCESRGRTPRVDEQAGILETQAAHAEAALVRASARGLPFVFCDTAPLLTAVYSEFVFGDLSLYARARELHARYRLTLLLQNDIAWVADGMMRDGPEVRGPVQELLESELAQIGAPVARVRGSGPARLLAALNALQGLNK